MNQNRIPVEFVARISETFIQSSYDDQPVAPDKGAGDQDGAEQGGPTNKGVLLLDASLASANIHSPTDRVIVNTAREKPEYLIDQFWQRRLGGTKLRAYRQQARKENLQLGRNKRLSKKNIRQCIR